MKNIIIIGIVVLCLFKFAGNKSPIIPNGNLNMNAVFGGNGTDAKRAAAFFYSQADAIEWDAHRTTPKYTSDLALEAYRVETLIWWTRGGGFSDKYPNFGPTVGAYLDQAVGTTPEKTLDEARRNKWIKAWRSLGDACAGAG